MWSDERIREEFDKALAVLRLPGLDNDGGPGDLAEEIEIMKRNHEVELKTLDECTRSYAELRNEFRKVVQAVKKARSYKNWPRFKGNFSDFVVKEIDELAELARSEDP